MFRRGASTFPLECAAMHDIRRLFRLLGRATLLRCPACGRPTFAKGLLSTHRACRVCGLLFEHDDGVVSVYGHNSRLVCKEGQQVRAGDLISYSGNTGYSTGPHLHFELRRDNKPFDGMPFMREHGVDMMKHIEVIRGGVIDPLS